MSPSRQQPVWHVPLKPPIDRERRFAEYIAKREEQERTAKLARQLIDAGYRALALKVHPDHGGSGDAMVRLQRARDMLRRLL